MVFTNIICEFPPDTSRHKKGNLGWLLSSSDSLMKWANTWACRWLTSIIGIFNERAKPFAKDTPTSNDPIKPGPRVNATALSCSLVTPALFKASCTTGTMFC